MAYNPFDMFRRNQKTLFAILTVFIMFMFVLNFGQGDFFQWVPQWLGSRKHTGEIVAVVDGSKLYESELSRKQTDRVLANEFMTRAASVASQNMEQYVRTGLASATPTSKAAVDEMLQARGLLFGGNQQFAQFAQQMYQASEQRLTEEVKKDNLSKDDQDLLRNAVALMSLDTTNAAASRFGYFFNQPNRTRKDEYEYALWMHKADKLGIRIAADDVPDLLAKEFNGRFADADFKDLEDKYLGRKNGYTRERLYAALADEFKVRAAQSVVLGPQTLKVSNPGTQAVSSPYDAFRFYREQCDAATFGVISVPVENYIPQVTGSPTAAEIQELFTKHRNEEPDPTKDRPGFREPRKLKFEWMEVRGDEPFYKTASVDALRKAEVQAKAALFLVPPMGLATWTQVAAVGAAALPEPALTRAYDDYKNRFKVEIDANMFPSFFGSAKLTGADVLKPGNLVAAAAASAGSLLTFGSPFTAGLVFEQRAAMEDRNIRARAGAAFLSNPFLPGAGVGWAAGAFGAAVAAMPLPLPVTAMKAELGTKVQAELARRLAEEDLDKFKLEMSKLGTQKDKDKAKAETKAYLNAFVKERGFKLGASKEFQTEYSVNDDEGLKPLKEKMLKGMGLSDAPVRFGRELFYEPDPRQQMNPLDRNARRNYIPAVSYYKPESYPDSNFQIRDGEPNYVIWRTEEIKADAPKSPEAAKAKIELAWKRKKARELAEKAANELAVKAGAKGTLSGAIDMNVRQLHTEYQMQFATPESRERTQYFLLNDVTPFPGKSPGAFSAGRMDPSPYTLRPSKNLPYPTQPMLDKLMKTKDKPFATTFVEADLGKDVYYVVTLLNRKELEARDFLDNVYPGLDPQFAGAINGRRQAEDGRKAREQAVNLLKVEFKVEKENAERLSDKASSSDSE